MREFVRSSIKVVASGLLTFAVGCGAAAGGEEVAQESAPVSASSFAPTLGPADVLAQDNAFYKDVSASTVYTGSKAITDAMQFGGGKLQVDYSIKVMQVGASTPKTSVRFNPDYTPDSDATPVPVPVGGALEDEAGYACSKGGDCHLIVIDNDARKLFELWNVDNTRADGTGSWTAADQTTWLMDGHYGPQGRGIGCTSADAAGLSVTAGLIGVREANRGQIDHAIRFILPNSMIRKGKAFVAPATHGTSATSSAVGAMYGTRLRLRAAFDETRVTSKGGRAVIRALKKYGMILADAGQIAFTAESDELYRAEGLSWTGVLAASDLAAVAPGDFDVVDFDASRVGSGDDCVRASDPQTTPRTTPPPVTTPPVTTPPVTTPPTTTPPVTTPPVTTPPVTTPTVTSVLGDGSFETSTSDFRIWPGSSANGDAPGRTTKAISGSSSMSATLSNSSAILFESKSATGKGTLQATAKIRNDGASTTTVRLCTGIYDQSWSLLQSCTPISLAPGATAPLSASYTVAASSSVQMVAVFVAPADGFSATVAVDDVFAAFK